MGYVNVGFLKVWCWRVQRCFRLDTLEKVLNSVIIINNFDRNIRFDGMEKVT
jgi:hypothetical protein